MKQIKITGPKAVSIIDVPKPSAKEDWVVVKIVTAPMCTEYKQFLSGIVDHPLGHEAAGEVVEVENSEKLAVGDRVVVMPQYPCGKCSLCQSGEYIHCKNNIDFQKFTGSQYGNSTFADYIVKPDWMLPKIPADISYDHASMLCCALGPTFGALERMVNKDFDTVLITGLGPVGLGGIINAKYKNCNVIAATKNQYRSELAIELGADKVFNSGESNVEDQILEFTSGRGVDLSMECSGQMIAQNLVLTCTQRNGKIAFIGESGAFKFNVSDDLLRKGLTLYGVWHYNYNGIKKLFELVKRSKEKLDKLITHKFKLSQIETAWNLQLTRECGKVILHP